MQSMKIKYLIMAALVLALFVVMLGAFTRLTDAGLGCPDWPGCYGQLVLPAEQAAREAAQQQYPAIPIESGKAWTEMAHRYAAGTLGLLIFCIASFRFRQAIQNADSTWRLPLALLLLVFFQAALGMWTVTLKLLPVVVMGHLLGGILIFSCLCLIALQTRAVAGISLPRWRPWVGLVLLMVFGQIALGGWVSSNYAGIACIGFPQCNGQWFPTLQLSQGFNLFSPVGANYQGGVLDSDVRVTIQFIHRLGAMLTAVGVSILSLCILRFQQQPALRYLAMAALGLVGLQFGLGIINVMYLLPLGVAVSHNGVAALLMATMFMMFYLTQGKAPNVR